MSTLSDDWLQDVIINLFSKILESDWITHAIILSVTKDRSVDLQKWKKGKKECWMEIGWKKWEERWNSDN